MKITKRRGAVSAYVVLVLGILLTVTLAVANFGSQSLLRVRQDRNSTIAEQAAFAAMDHTSGKAYYDLTQSNSNGKFAYSALTLSSDLNTIAPGCTAYGWVTPTSDSMAYVTGTVTYKGITRSVRSYFKEKDVGIWNNVIFAGAGASGQSINGNVNIAGSVHILGDGEPYLDLNGNGQHDNAEAFTDKNPKNGKWDPGETYTDSNGDGVYTAAEPYNDTNANGVYDPPMTQSNLDGTFSGNGQIQNNYVGLSSTLSAKIPAIPTIGGVKTLSAEVRVKHGLIGLSGSSTVGQSGIIDSGLSKGTVDGTYVSDGWAGNKGASAVNSDNGSANTYDLDNLGIQFPVITGIGAQTYVDKTGSSWSTHQAYLDSKSLTVAVPTITTSTTTFSYGPDANGNAISWNKTTGTLNITGVVKIVGNLQIGAKDTLKYTGNGTIYSTGSIYIDGDFLPAAGYIFPTTAKVGMIAAQDINIATGNGSSHLDLAGAFYAQGTVKSAKQTDILGTVVASYFDMGTNVPNIWQVPSLPYNMPPAMPGDKHYISFKVQSFRDRSPLPGQSDSFSGGSPYTG